MGSLFYILNSIVRTPHREKWYQLMKSPGICQGLIVCGMGGVHDADNIVHAIRPLVGHERTEAHC